MTVGFNQFLFVAESMRNAFATIANLADDHQVVDFDVRSIQDVQMVRLTTNAWLECVEEAMLDEDDQLMLPTLRQLQPEHGALN